MRKKILPSIVVSLMAIVLMFGILAVPASAATSLKKATISISSSYYTYTGKAIKPTVTVTLNKKKISSKNYTVSYKNNKNVGKATITVKGKGSYTSSVSKSFYIRPKNVGSLKATSYSTKIKLSWGKVTGAKGYQVYRYTDGSWKKLATTTSTSYTVSSLKSATTYKFRVRAYSKAGEKSLYSPSYTSLSATTTIGKATSFTLSNVTKNSATLKWNKVSAASEYRVYLINEATEIKKTYVTTATSYNFTGLTAGTDYTVRIRAYNKSKDILGNYSDYFAFKTAPADVSGFKASANASAVSLSWNSASGVSGYEIQMCTYDSNGIEGTYTKIGTVKNNFYTVNNLTPYVNYGFRIRAYANSDNGVLYGDFVKSGKVMPSISKVTGLVVDQVTNKTIQLSWNGVSGASGYKLNIQGKPIVNLSASTTEYTIEGLEENKSYSVSITAYYKGSDGLIRESEAVTINPTTDDGSVDKVEFTSKPTTMSIDETYTVGVRVLPEYATNKKVAYSSSNTSVATINASGVITALASGTTKIIVTTADGYKTASFTLKVEDIVSTSISVPSSITVYLGETTMIVPTFKPANTTNKKYTVTGTDYTYSYKSGSIISSTKTDTCKIADYLYVGSDGTLRGIKTTVEPKTDKEFSFVLTVRASDSGKTATTRVNVKERMLKVSYKGDDSPWYYGNSAKLSVELGASISSKYALSDIRYRSSDTSVATVNSKGEVTCVGGGSATITAYTPDNAYSDSYNIYVRSIVTANKDYFENCKVGSTYQINATLYPNSTEDGLFYRLADSSTDVISVNESTGAVRFLKNGSAAVIVSSKSGMANTKQIWFTSNVSNVPSNSLSETRLIETIKKYADSVKTADYLPALNRSDVSTFDNFKLTDKSATASGALTVADLEDMFADLAAPASIYLPAGSDWKNFNANVPVRNQMMTIVDGLSADDVKNIKVVDNGSYTYNIKMTLEDEYFTALPSNATNSAHGKVFDILTSAYLSDALNGINSSSSGMEIFFDAFTQRYHDSSLTVTINKATGKVVDMRYDMNIDVNISNLQMKYSTGFFSYTYKADIGFSCNNVVSLNFSNYKY